MCILDPFPVMSTADCIYKHLVQILLCITQENVDEKTH